MRIDARIGGRCCALDFEKKGGRLHGRTGGREFAAEVIDEGPFRLTVRSGSRTYRVTYSFEGQSLFLDLGTREVEVAVLDSLHSSAAEGAGGAVRGRREVLAAMPGKVVAVRVEVGDEVTSGQGLVVVEAMKMENEVPSPKTGRVIVIGVVPGQTVETGALLVTVE